MTPGSRRRALDSGLIARDKIARVMQATLECREGHHSYPARHSAGNVKSGNKPSRFIGIAQTLELCSIRHMYNVLWLHCMTF